MEKYAIDVTYDTFDEFVENYYANDINEINKLLEVLLERKHEILKIEIFELKENK
jgi:hypothetical protein